MKVIGSIILILTFISCGKTYEKRPVTEKNGSPIVNIQEIDDPVPTAQNNNPNTYTGKDYLGNTRTCEDKYGSVMCSQQFTQSDQFSLQCRDNGHKRVMCNCHDWICVTN